MFVTPKSGDSEGVITITDYYDTTDVIVEMPTERTIGLEMTYGEIG